MRTCVHVCVLAPGICLLSHVTCLVLPDCERCHPGVGGGNIFPSSHCFQKRRRGGLFPSRVVRDPEEETEGCCHGGLCEANSSRVKWEIFIPRVRQSGCRQPEREGWDILDTARPWCVGRWALGRVLPVLSLAVYLSVHVGRVRSPALH